MEPRPRNANGTFQKGDQSGARRKKGTLNKLTADIRAGAIEGFARHGSNGRGEGGFAGFCYYLAKKHPKAAAKIVEKLLPLQVSGNLGGIGAQIGTVNIVSVPSGSYLSSEDIERMRKPGLLELEHDIQHDVTPIEPDDAAVEANLVEVEDGEIR